MKGESSPACLRRTQTKLDSACRVVSGGIFFLVVVLVFVFVFLSSVVCNGDSDSDGEVGEEGYMERGLLLGLKKHDAGMSSRVGISGPSKVFLALTQPADKRP